MPRVRISNAREDREFDFPRGPVEFGRGPGGARVVIQDQTVSRDHLRMTPVGPDVVRIENLSLKYPVGLGGEEVIQPGESVEVGLPARLVVGETLVRIEPGEPETMAGPNL